MPRVYVTELAVPRYELDLFGELKRSAYARFLQEAATAASADAGFPEDWYATAGTGWLIRRSRLDYLRSVGPAASRVEVRTWVADFRRVRSRREYEMRAGGELVLAAHTDWVYVERASGRPLRVPPEMVRAFAESGAAPAMGREPLVLPEPPAGAFAVPRRVEFRDVDALGHVNNASYLDYVEEALLQASEAAGWSLDRMLDAGGSPRAVAHDIEYRQEARYGESLDCVGWWLGGDASALERATEIRRAETVLTRARSRWAWRDGASGVTGRFPEALRSALTRV
jgi:acyl-CoA thioester hydrolase